jgi:hypothetical protein
MAWLSRIVRSEDNWRYDRIEQKLEYEYATKEEPQMDSARTARSSTCASNTYPSPVSNYGHYGANDFQWRDEVRRNENSDIQHQLLA